MTAAQSALPPGADPRVHTRLLARVRAAALAGGTPPAAPRPVIGASWRRLRGSGLDPSGTPDVAPLDGPGLERRRAESGLVPLLPLLRERLLPVARDAGQVLVVGDAGCRVLWREGGPGVRRLADRLGFVEGSSWDEDVVGTNAIGTSVVVRAPLQVHAAEHYAEGHQPWTCAAAPLRDPVTGRVLGVVDLSGPASTVHPSTIALVDAVAALAGQELSRAHVRHVERLRTLAAPMLARLTGPALVVGVDGCTAAATGLAAPDRVALPDEVHPGPLWIPALGRCTVEPLPGGWLLRPHGPGDDDRPAGLVLDLAGPRPQVQVTSASGSWAAPLSLRHAEILLALTRHPAGRSAAALAGDLFGDPTRTVTVRAEVSRLRRTLGSLLLTQPYRVDEDVAVELRLPTPVARLLPASTAPLVERLRQG
ncbi:GAF domain-containing protein [Geodermatophilus sp. DSM 45219]|uniref:GAF domain-containing protein n=1 Tax=Geodermatophilus sp. DSM 45219 TaxID=1881103 RepID=UPI000882DE98|nr:GAF domain-containing protein [Geodermatophilus sp. DSM 45219]SDN82200.1 GAF domain-containing protein [Geodermatophilus sp. DSM 45219]